MRVRTSLTALLALCLGSGGCTLAKPFVGLVKGPPLILRNAKWNWNGRGCPFDPRALVAILAITAAVGAGAGLVTGVISDVQVLCGRARHPTRNWWDPFATNTMPTSGR